MWIFNKVSRLAMKTIEMHVPLISVVTIILSKTKSRFQKIVGDRNHDIFSAGTIFLQFVRYL